jgi:NADPH:quinone reductase-like Zn-dependent oxidoreductase
MVGDRNGRGMLSVMGRLIAAIVLSRFESRKMVTFLARPINEDLTVISELMVAGKVTPVIDRRYSLSEVVEAIRYLGKGHARGKVVISL